MRRFSMALATALCSGWAGAQERRITFPDVEGYRTLKCDFHQHSVFSDGSVWPDIRIEEALKDGLDAISLTEHLEYQPHREDIPHEDRNRSYELAKELAEGTDLLVVHGSEITRDMPPGHSNAIFIRDANRILQDDPLAAFREAQAQGAFIFWNHPDWLGQVPDGIARLSDMHRQLIADGLLHGIEVVNEHTVSEEALSIALDHGLTILGTSDIHGLVDWEFEVPGGGHRPITLVLARERTIEGLREALIAKRTVVWFENQLVGLPEWMDRLLRASVVVRAARLVEEATVVQVELENRSDASYLLRNLGGVTFHRSTDIVSLEPRGVTTLFVKGAFSPSAGRAQRVPAAVRSEPASGGQPPSEERGGTETREALGVGPQRTDQSLGGESIELSFEVLNALVAPRKHPELRLLAKVSWN